MVVIICSTLFTLIYHKTSNIIKEREKAEKNVNILKQQIEFILGATKTGINIIDPDYNIKFINSEWEKIYGDPSGQKCYRYFMDRDKPCEDCKISKALETKETIVSEGVLIKENNRPVQITTMPFQDKKGNWRVAEVKVDISERKLVEEKTQKALETLETIVQGLPIGVAIVGKDKIVRDINKAALKMMGKTQEMIVGKICHQNMCPAQKGNCPVWDHKKDVDNSEKVILHANGQKIPILKTALPITLNGEEVLLEAFVDISQRKKFEEELKQHRDHLEELVELRTEKIKHTNDMLQQEIETRKQTELALIESNKAIKESTKQLQEFLYVASHDLREPSRKINAFGKLLSESSLSKLTEDDMENLSFIIEGSNKMQQMVDSLLKYSRVAGQKINYKQVNLHKIINNLKENELIDLIDQKEAIIEIPNELPNVFADECQIKLLLQNLIINAINFHQQGKKPEIIITSQQVENNKIKIEITDNGIGIHSQFHDKIFSMFRKLHSNNKYDGMGVGLAICKKIAERHNSKINIESEEGKGTKFSFTLSKAKNKVLQPIKA